MQIVLQFAPIAQLRRHVGLEESDRMAPFGLGAVECHIRVGEKGCRVSPVDRTRCDADAQSNAQLSSGDLDVIAQRGLELQSQLTHGCGLRVADGDDDELVTADARQEGTFCNRLQTPRHLAQQCIADRMAVKVVDLLEAIEIQAQDREPPGRAQSLIDGRRQIVGKRRAIVQAGQ